MCSVFAGAMCPVSEKRVAVLTSEGRILVWGVEFEQVGMRGESGNNGGRGSGWLWYWKMIGRREVG